MKIHSFREDPSKPSVVKDMGFWWATVRRGRDVNMSAHLSHAEAFKAATRMAGEDQ
jgi:hypothetical protein